MQEYTPNSHRFKEEQRNKTEETAGRQIAKVVKGPVTTKKRNNLGKVAGIFISEDINNVGDYLLKDVLVPTLKKAALGALDMILNGGSGNYTGKSSTSKVSYRKYYEDSASPRATTSARPRFDYDDIVFNSRGEAEAVLDEMNNVIDRYGFVKVADMYDMADLSQPYTSNKYGWTNLRSAEVLRAGGGYIIKLPKAMPLD